MSEDGGEDPKVEEVAGTVVPSFYYCAWMVTSAVSLGWSVPEEHMQAYTIADLREVDLYHRYWLTQTTPTTEAKDRYGEVMRRAAAAAYAYMKTMNLTEFTTTTTTEGVVHES